MFYLFTKNILIEVHQSNDLFYIGDISFDSLPEHILNNSFESANWNRALKFRPLNNLTSEKVFYYMLEIELFLFQNKIKVLTKDFFFQQVVDSKLFQEIFLDVVLKHYFKNIKKLNLTLNNENNFIDQFKPSILKNVLQIDSFDNFVVFNQSVDFKSKKFKTIFIYNEEIENFSWSIINKNQIIYLVPSKVKNNLVINSFALDVKKQIFLLSLLSVNNPNLALELAVTNKKIYNEIFNSIVESIIESDDLYKNWHLYNFTKDFEHLRCELDQVENLNDYINEISKVLKQNYSHLLSVSKKL